ncbi:ATP/GTP-binding protein [Streptomyces seoulensis]
MLNPMAAATALFLAAAAAAVTAHADGGGRGIGTPGCEAASKYVAVCAADDTARPDPAGGRRFSGTPAAGKRSGSGGSPASACTYTKLTPQPPADNLAMREGREQGGKGAVYQVVCPDTGRIGVVWVPDGVGSAAEPAVDPEVVVRRAVDAMRLDGPAIVSPRSVVRYTVGVPMWLWVRPTPTTYGPVTARASAGRVTVRATARVTAIRWEMGDGATVTCTGPGTAYSAAAGMSDSPDCGHRYTHISTGRPSGRYPVTATSTWTITWQAEGGLADAGTFTETRFSTTSARVGELQVVN